MNNRTKYEMTINTAKAYKIGLHEFATWLEKGDRKAIINNQMEELIKGNIDYYHVAWDYTIPITMVKYLEMAYLKYGYI